MTVVVVVVTVVVVVVTVVVGKKHLFSQEQLNFTIRIIRINVLFFRLSVRQFELIDPILSVPK